MIEYSFCAVFSPFHALRTLVVLDNLSVLALFMWLMKKACAPTLEARPARL